jgi:mono/diheme cytochrome c family protein
MNKFLIISGFVIIGVLIAGCNKTQRNPGRVYMPDMNYSRAYETYSSNEALQNAGANYSARPVAGTIARGDEMPFPLTQDRAGDTTNYFASKQIKNPLVFESIDMKEAERLYLVNCGICHGTKLDGNGPLFSSGIYPAKPATLVGDAKYQNMPEGQMFYSVTYGKNMMGSYASQLNTKQRWMVIAYIKSKQGNVAPMINKPADSISVKK